MICPICEDCYFASSGHECSYNAEEEYNEQEEWNAYQRWLDRQNYEGTAWWCNRCGKFLDPHIAANSFERHCECGEYLCDPLRATEEEFELSITEPDANEAIEEGPRTPDRHAEAPENFSFFVRQPEEHLGLAVATSSSDEEHD